MRNESDQIGSFAKLDKMGWTELIWGDGWDSKDQEPNLVLAEKSVENLRQQSVSKMRAVSWL